MANLIEYIQSQVYENSTEDISGSIMQQVLTRMASDEGVVNVHTISGQTPFADYNNAQAARDAVPAGFKKLGLIITYKLSSGWYVDEFIGSATSGWSTASNWKCLGPISVSQNASTGKTTITIGSESFDVATQPVSVSQNMLTIGNDVVGGLNDIVNINSLSEHSAAFASEEEAYSYIASQYRKIGMLVVFMLADGWHCQQFIGASFDGFTTGSNWKNINDSFPIMFNATGRGSSQISRVLPKMFKDRAYKFTGLGWAYTASQQSRMIIYGLNIGEENPVALVTFSYNDPRTEYTLIPSVTYDLYFMRFRVNSGDDVSIMGNDITEVSQLSADLSPKVSTLIDHELASYYTFTGNGTSQRTIDIPKLIKNRKYLLSGTGWSYTASTQGKIILYGVSDGVGTAIWSCFYNDTNTSHLLSFTTQYDSYYLRVRANSGEINTIFLSDVTDADTRIAQNSQSISDTITPINTIANAYHGNHWDMFPFFLDYLDSKYWTDEQTHFNAFKDIVTSRQGTGKYQLALITDTHEGGLYAPTTYAFRCIALFNKLTEVVDAAIHGGDISCDYGTSKQRQFSYMQEVMKLFKINGGKNFFITKGNHDEKDDEYQEVDANLVDWDNETYFTMDFSTAIQVTKQTYRGGQLYIHKKDLIPDSLFRFIQANNAPTDAVWGDGAYYYWDYADLKIRFVVANSFPVNDSGVASNSEEWRWFAEDALDLSDKTTPTDWFVVVIRHTESTTLTKFNTIVNAFINGTSMSIDEATVNYGTLNGGGIKLLHLHGHEHRAAGYSNMAGYLDIGFRNGNVGVENLGSADRYSVYVLTIDTTNKKLISDNMRYLESLTYDYNNSILELGIGKTAQMARSGLSNRTAALWTSSDNSIATVEDGIVTGVSAGNVTITGVEDNITVTYTIKVV